MGSSPAANPIAGPRDTARHPAADGPAAPGTRAGAVLGAALLAALAMATVVTPAAAGAPAGVDLGSATSYVVLAGAGIGTTGLSQVTGDVGAYPRPAISDQLAADVVGAVHRGGAAAQAAQADLADAYAAAAGAIPTGTGLAGAIGDATLPAGTYTLTGDTVSLRGRLVLDGQDDRAATWIFQVPADLATTPGSTIDLVNGAQACNVFWQVGGTATLGAGSAFAGTVLATRAVTVGAGAEVEGRVLSMTGRVLLGSNTVTLPVCTAAGPDVAPVAPVAPVAAVVGVVPTARPAAPVVPAGGDGRPSLLPIMALATLVLAVLLDRPRRRPAGAPLRDALA